MIFYKLLSFTVKTLLVFNFFYINQINKVLSENKPNFPKSGYIDKIPKNDYILGKGDSLRIILSRDKFFKDLITKDAIDINGTITLPKLKRVYVEGLTVGELEEILNQRYQEFINFPEVEIKIISYRDISFYIDGEVINPGLYNISSLQANKNKDPKINQMIDYDTPTIFDAIRLAGGITKKASLKNISIIRNNSISNGGGKIKANLDFSNMFISGDLSQNIGLTDGDIINIPTSSIDDKELISKAIRTNLNPKTINVVLAGKIEIPGKVNIPISSSLNDAILISGGTKPLPGRILLVRFQSEGTVEKKRFRFSPKAMPGSYRNPILENGDLIFIGKGAISNVTSVLNEITSPLAPVVTSYGLYKALTE